MTTAISHRRYIPFSHAHYAGDLVDGAYVLGLFGDVATDLCIHHDGDEGLFASYSSVTFHAPVRAGDVLVVTGEIVHVGNRSRRIEFTASVVARSQPSEGPTASRPLPEPQVVVSAVGTVVVPAPGSSGGRS